MKKELTPSMEKQKIELVLLRIKNNFYGKDEVLEKVALEIVNESIKKDQYFK